MRVGIESYGLYMPRFTIRRAQINAAWEKKGDTGGIRLAGLEVHDCFTITELITYEDRGFCANRQGGKLVEKGETGLAGRIPVNPSGGLLAKGHPLGATGVARAAPALPIP